MIRCLCDSLRTSILSVFFYILHTLVASLSVDPFICSKDPVLTW